MNRWIITLLGAVTLAGAGYLGLTAWLRPNAVSAGPRPGPEITFVCRETGAMSRGPRQPTPAVNPETGRATLVQALYCPRCQGWRPAPPPGFAERSPRGPVCPVHGTAVFEAEPNAVDSGGTSGPGAP